MSCTTWPPVNDVVRRALEHVSPGNQRVSDKGTSRFHRVSTVQVPLRDIFRVFPTGGAVPTCGAARHVSESSGNERVGDQGNQRVGDQDSDEDFNEDVDVVGPWDDQSAPDSPPDDEDSARPVSSRLRVRIATSEHKKHKKPRVQRTVPQYYEMQLLQSRITDVCGVEWQVRWTGDCEPSTTSWHPEENLIFPQGDCDDLISEFNGEVIAIQYNGPKRAWTCWNRKEIPFQTTRPHRIRQEDLDRALENKGRRIKLTGAKPTAAGQRQASDPIALPVFSASGVLQGAGGYCALSSVVNGFSAINESFPPWLQKEIETKGPNYSLEEVAHMVCRAKTRHRLEKPKGVVRQNLFDWVKRRTSGVYVIDFVGHCATWNAGKKLITDADLHEPEPLNISDDTIDDTLHRLKFERVTKIYRIGMSAPPQKKKRKRK
jgi:hypothetical protein